VEVDLKQGISQITTLETNPVRKGIKSANWYLMMLI
jgi:hypothetical protein